MAKKDEALEILLCIYGALCEWEHDYRAESDRILLTIVDHLVTPFVEEAFPHVYEREKEIDYSC